MDQIENMCSYSKLESSVLDLEYRIAWKCFLFPQLVAKAEQR